MEKKALKLSEKQLDFLANSVHDINIASGAVSSGKTFILNLRCQEFIECEAPKGSLLLFTGKTVETLYDNVLRDLLKMNSGFTFKKDPPRLYYPSKQIEIACISANDDQSWKRIQGKSVSLWLGDECTNYPENFFNMCQSRLRAGGKLWPMFLSCNPDTPTHYIKTRFIDQEGLNPDLDIKSFHFKITDNPILSDKYVRALKASYSGIYYKRYIEGIWCLADGAIYDEFDQDAHVIKPFNIPYTWDFYRSIDFGFSNPFVCLWGAYDKKNKTLYIYDEYYKNKDLMENHAKQIKKRDVMDVDGMNLPIHWTSTDGDWDPQNINELKKYGIYIKHAIKDANKLGISRVKSLLKIQEDGKPRLFVFNNCKNLIKEFGLYHWKKSRDSQNLSEEPEKKDDHSMDCLKYLVSRITKGKMGVSKISASDLGF